MSERNVLERNVIHSFFPPYCFLESIFLLFSTLESFSVFIKNGPRNIIKVMDLERERRKNEEE